MVSSKILLSTRCFCVSLLQLYSLGTCHSPTAREQKLSLKRRVAWFQKGNCESLLSISFYILHRT